MSLFATKPLDLILADAEGGTLKQSLSATQLAALGIGTERAAPHSRGTHHSGNRHEPRNLGGGWQSVVAPAVR